MARYSLRILTPAAAAGAAFAAIRAGANRVIVRKIALVLTQAVATQVGIIRPLTTGTVPVSAGLGQALQSTSGASATNVDTSWSVAATIAATPLYLDGANLAGVVGNGQILTWPDPEPLAIEPNAQLLLWNPSGAPGGILQATFVWDE